MLISIDHSNHFVPVNQEFTWQVSQVIEIFKLENYVATMSRNNPPRTHFTSWARVSKHTTLWNWTHCTFTVDVNGLENQIYIYLQETHIHESTCTKSNNLNQIMQHYLLVTLWYLEHECNHGKLHYCQKGTNAQYKTQILVCI